MKGTFKKVLAGSVAAAMVLGLAACGGSKTAETAAASAGTENGTSAESAATAQSAGSTEAAASGDQITLRMSWWGGDSRDKATSDAIAAFEQANPGIKVETEYGAWSGWTDKISTQLAGNSEPDLLQINWNWIYQFSPDGTGFYDMNELKDSFDLTQYDQKLLDQMTINGKLQGIPVSTTGRVFYWNQQTWDKAGLALPKSFADLLAAGPVFKEKLGDDYYPLAAGEYDLTMILTYYMQEKYNKAWVQDGKLNYTADELADGFDFLKSLEADHVIPSQEKLKGDAADSLDKNPNFSDGHYAGLFEWDSSVSKMQGALSDGQTLVIGEFPADYGTPSTIYKISMGFAVSKNSQHPKEAAKLAEYLLNGDGVAAMGMERGVVASKKAQDTLSKAGTLKGTTFDANKAATANYVFPLDPYYEDSKLKDTAEGAYYEIIDNMSFDGEDSKDLAQELIDAVNEVEAANVK